MNKILFVALTTVIGLSSCHKDKIEDGKELIFDFNTSDHGWNSFFSDYPVGEEDFYDLTYTHTGLPSPLDQAVKSLKISGNNHSDDLLSIVYRKIIGLQPETRYEVTFDIQFASDACIECVGVGGSPNLDLGAGGLSYSPVNNLKDGYYRPNFTVEIQGQRSNNTMKALGGIGTNESPSDAPFRLVSLNNTDESILLSTNEKGELWIIIGTDSGFESTTTLYFTKIKVTLSIPTK